MSAPYDGLIVGAGPGGAICGYQLAKMGHGVLILEKERLPRPKVCAGGLPQKVPRILDFDLSPALEVERREGLCAFRSQPPLSGRFRGGSGLDGHEGEARPRLEEGQ